MPTFMHRPARLGDLAAILAIYNATVASRLVTADTEPVTLAQRQGWFAEHDPLRRPLWVIHKAGDTQAHPDVLGWLSFSDFYGRPAYAGTAELSIYVAAAWRGKGIGSYCLEQAIAAAPRIGVHTLLAFIFGHNAPSLALFDRSGFARWGELPRVANLDGAERDLVILGKRVA